MRLFVVVVVVLLLFVFVCAQDTQNTNNGSCNTVCLTIIGGLFAIFILSIPIAFIVYFLAKFIWDKVRECLKRKQHKIKPDLNQIEMTDTSQNGHSLDLTRVRGSVTLMQIIDEVPEN